MSQLAHTSFIVQSDLIQSKVDLAVSRSINEVVQQIIKLRQDVHKEIGVLRQDVHKEVGSLKNEMNSRFSNLEKDMEAVKTRLGMREQTVGRVRGHFIDYSFKASWLVMFAVLSGTFSFLAAHI